MNGRDYEEASYLVGKMRALEQEESALAAERMALSYREAGDRVRKRYEAEREQIIQQCVDEMAALGAREKEALVPVQNRLAKLYKVRTDLTIARRSAAKGTPTVQTRAGPQGLKTLPRVRLDAKLKLPPLSRPGGRSHGRSRTTDPSNR
jgi:hypothetical protein